MFPKCSLENQNFATLWELSERISGILRAGLDILLRLHLLDSNHEAKNRFWKMCAYKTIFLTLTKRSYQVT